MWTHLHFFAFAKETIDVNPHFCPVSADIFLKAFAVFSELLKYTVPINFQGLRYEEYFCKYHKSIPYRPGN